MIKYREITETDNAAVAAIVRDNLKQVDSLRKQVVEK